MKTIVLASVLALARTASAQPSLTASAPAPAPASYVEAGVTLGAFVGLYAALTVEAGHRLGNSALWAHGMVVAGETGGIDEGGTAGRQRQARAGVEARGCVVSQICAIAGVDLAVAHGDYMGYEDSGNRTEGLAIGRIGLDIGGSTLRLRPGFELGTGVRGFEQAAFTAAIAGQF
jgi:hypothetical protein